MKKEQFLRIIGDIDDDLILEAEAKPRIVPRYVRVVGSLAACLVISVALLIAVPLLNRSMNETTADCAPMEEDFMFSADMEYSDVADDMLKDKYVEDTVIVQSSASGNGKPSKAPAETAPATVYPAAKPETEIAKESAADTSLPQPLVGWTFYFCDGKTWRTDTKTYPGGVPSMQIVVNDWLKAAGMKVTCTGARSEVVGEKDEVKNGIVTHTVGVRTWYITLDGDITDAQCRALVNTVLAASSPSPLHLAEIQTPSKTYAPTQASPIQ